MSQIFKLKEYATEIVPHLWVGERFGCAWAQKLGFNTICVLESPCNALGCVHRRILSLEARNTYAGLERQVEPGLFKDALKIVSELHSKGPTLVHCGAGIERSPLVVAVYLSQKFNTSLESAYRWIKQHRNVIEDRTVWLGSYK